MKNPREVAVEIVRRFMEDNAWVTPLLRTYHSNFADIRDSELMTELVYGTVKNFLKLRKIANTYLNQGNFDFLRPIQQALILVSIYELLYLTKIPEYATIHSYVEISKRLTNLQFSKLLNGLLRNIQRKIKVVEFEPYEEFSINKELFDYLRQKIDLDFLITILTHSLQPHKVYLRCDDLIDNKPLITEHSSKCGLENVIFPEAYLVKNSSSLTECQFCKNIIFQDLSTQIAQHLVPYVPRGTYLDLTSAPSLKSSFLAKRFSDVLVISNDLNFKKLKKAKESFVSHNHFFVCSDAQIPPFKKLFDVVILDPPCSGLGTLRRKPEIKIRMSPKTIKNLITLQENLLRSASDLTKPGGYLCYMTCTVNPEENEEMVARFLKHRSDFIIEPIKSEEIEFIQREYGVYIDGSKYDCDYFFISKLRRTK
jgi:16S rRNA (cytosine967-C5)-methyltransferase